MICFLVKRVLGFLFKFLLRFLFRSFSRAMGCFLGCLRVRDDHDLPTSDSKSGGVVISRNPLSLFLSKAFKEKEDSPPNDKQNFCLGSRRDDKGLKDEAKSLKACGSLAGKPAEIQKASGKLKVSPSCSKDPESSKFHSWLPNISVEKRQLEVQPSTPATPIKFCEEWGNATNSSEHTPSSCISVAQDTQCDSLCPKDGSRTENSHIAYKTCTNETEKHATSASPWSSATDMQRRNKSVHFECDTDSTTSGSSSTSGGQHMEETESLANRSAYKPSPYPTPLKLSDEMQTPGTVYPATLGDLPNGNPRVRCQMLYSIYNLGEKVSRRKILEEEDFHPAQDSCELSNSELPQNSIPNPKDGLKKISYENESKVELSLSSWLKPASVIPEERNRRMETTYGQIPHLCKTPASRPIIGMVAAHWNEDEDSQIPSPKWRDGNGIPNSTNKYKEDQKVNWHATPFEERLEKALSEETFTSQRNHVCGKPSPFDENEEIDSASSQLQPSTHPQSVVSF